MGVLKMAENLSENQTQQKCTCCTTGKKKKRNTEELKCLTNRLNRIEGQIKGIRKMLENDSYCPDILIQVSAVNAALNSFNKVLLSNHIHTCLVNEIKKGNEEVVDELVCTLQKLMK